MLRKILVFAVLFSLFLQGAAFAQSLGEVVFRDALYGATIGGLLGTAVYFSTDEDDRDFTRSIGVGVAIGTVAGLAYGVAVDAKSLAAIDGRGVKFAFPTPRLGGKDNGLMVSTSLLTVRWNN